MSVENTTLVTIRNIVLLAALAVLAPRPGVADGCSLDYWDGATECSEAGVCCTPHTYHSDCNGFVCDTWQMDCTDPSWSNGGGYCYPNE